MEKTRSNGRLHDSVEQIDFIDIGGSVGGSYDAVKKRFGYQNGLAIDIDPRKVEAAIENKVPSICLDATKMSIFGDNSCKLISIMHTLEHLPNTQIVEDVLRESLRVASDTIWITGPMYYLDYLKPLGFQFYWSNWVGHTCLIEPDEIIQVMNKLAFESGTTVLFDLQFKEELRVKSSADPCVFPIGSEIDRNSDYNADIDPPKNCGLIFGRDIFRSFELFFKIQ